jgi:alpha-beta hydrolase superfamily lysophospholipase
VVRFSDDDGFDFAIRCLLNGVPYGMADPGELFAATADVAPGDADNWFEALTGLGARLEAEADARAAQGYGVSAAGDYLRAANYRYAGFWYVLGTRDPSRWANAWRAHRRCLDAALARRPGVARVDTELADVVVFRAPGATADRAAPVLVVQGGLGAPLSDALMTGVDDALSRGWHAVAFDGPGQGARRVRDGRGPVRDWGAVITAVVDAALEELGDTADATRAALVGIADGAALALQGAACDARVAAVVCDPGVLRPVDVALGQLPTPVVDAWHTGRDDAVVAACRAALATDPQTAFTVAKLTEQWPGRSLTEVLHELAAWDVTPHLDQVRVPVLVCDPEAATSFPGQSAELVAALGSRATLAPFLTSEGAGLDCEIGAPIVRATRIADWLDDVVGHERSRG